MGGTIEVSADSDGVVANLRFGDTVDFAGLLNQSETSLVEFGADLNLQSGAQWNLDDTATATVGGNLDQQTGSGLNLEEGTTLSVTGDFSANGLSTIEAG